MKLISEKKFQLYYILVAIILACVLAIFYYNNLKVKSTSDSAELAQEILRKNDNVLLDILDIETGTRGYIISENNLFLETFNNAVLAMNKNLASLSVLTKNNPEQAEQVASLKIKTAEKLVLIRKLIDDRNENLLQESEKTAILKSGKIITDEIKDIISEINYDEYNSLKQRKVENENNIQNAEILFFILLILIFVIFTLVFVIVKNLKIRNDELEAYTASQKLLSNYSHSLIEASQDPLVTININGKITGMNEATVRITGVEREKLIGSDFLDYFTEPQMAQEVYQEVFAKGSVSDSPLTIRHKEGKLTDVLFNGSIYKDDKGVVLGIVIVARDIAEQKWALDLRIANRELAFQNNEKEKRAAELVIANHELAFQNTVKEKRAAELVIANEELLFLNNEKEKRAAELYVANEELIFQTGEKEKRAAELVIADIELDFQTKEKEKREIVNRELESLSKSAKLASQYSLSLIEASRDPLVTISIEGKITDMNEATVKITGLEREKLLNSDFFTYFTEPQKAREVYQEVFAKGSVADSPLTLRHKDGKLTDVLFNGSVYKDEHGNVLGVVVVARDITDQKMIETELIEAKVFAELATGIAEEEKRNAEYAALIAENAVKAKQQFLSNMSHEIRTPMNAIIGFTKVVLKTDLTDKQKEYLSAIKMSGDALIVLINDILDLAKVDAGKMTFEKIPFKLKSSIMSMLHLFETKIQEKNLKLITEYDPNIPAVIVGDPVRLHQIILNLVSNAVKFTSKGKITVSVRLIDEDNENTTVEFAITDTGIGVPKEKIARIFDNFQQASSGTSRIYGGTGLGLAIVKQLVEPQGGTINVESEVGVGTTFSFRLNFQKTNLDAELDTEILELDSDINNIKVLVVEDIALNQLLMKTLLDDFGFERDIAENGKIAIEKLKEKEYDVILMDLQMPVMNGFETTEYIRKTLNSQIPIIALTADVTTVDLAKCKAVGMNDYIAKPVDERLLYSKIVSTVRKTSIIKSAQHKRKDMPKKQKCIDLEYLSVRTKSNPKLMMEMIAAYLQQTPPLINAMRQSLQNKDWALLKSSVHKMIPSFSIMGLSSEFEDMAKKVQDSATAHENMDEINNLVLQLENICNQACKELEIEFNNIKNTN
ncbi:PAS domain S-box protein [Flavobacterium degerlachei]|jgi:PAS domain S-box-containing protein|uniref:Sensory/regulatory protein RpfC n=1 Tax=Flavobacterium degerlachei TaxID=229203 RepID=A0A1H3BQW3_9FLAO|nr:PAS domain S-box protein [Flavobacterium degerlachei]SDX44175.1 PAS domain S-box-containing protein [Flavobacterium degerlachei]